MRRFVAGATVGALAVGGAWWVTSWTGTEPTDPGVPARGNLGGDENPRVPPPRAPAPRAERPAQESAVAPLPGTPFPAGVALLRIGEGFVFGASGPIPRGDLRGADVVCLDIRERETTLRCIAGGGRADVPLGAVGIPPSARDAAELVADAPEDLAPADVRLVSSAGPRDAGIGFGRGASGATYKLWILETGSDADALSRFVRIGYAPVPARKGGGVIAAVVATPAGDAPTLRDLDAVIAAGDAIPGADFTNFLHGDYERLSSLPAELVLDERKYLVLDDPLATTIEFNRYSGLVASRGVAPSGKVRIRSYTGVDVRGEMAGTIDVESYAYVHVGGDLAGRLDVNSYATVVIDGDLRGEVTVSSYATLLLRGRLLGKLTIRSSSSEFWFQQWMGRSGAEALAGAGNGLHLRESDLAQGKHEDVPGWKTVTVAEEAWKLVAR